MIFKASVDYGVRIMLCLAIKNDVCSSREIAEEMSIPRDYLIQIALLLRNAGLIKARPGKNGGYILAKSPEKISLARIIDVFDNELKHGRKKLKKTKKTSDLAAGVYDMQKVVGDSLNSYLGAITLQDLLAIVNGETEANDVMAAAFEAEAKRLRS